MTRYGIAAELEHRPDKPYDEVNPSTVILPNGTLAATTDLALSCVLARAAYQNHLKQQETAN